MRCFYMVGRRIAGVEFLTKEDDAGRIAEATRHFETIGRAKFRADGFEVWDRDRFVYRYPPIELWEGRPSVKGT